MKKYEMSYYNAYNRSGYHSVREAYARPSTKKVSIEEEIISRMENCHGYDYRIISKNDSFFSCAYRTKENGLEYLHVFTPTKQLFFPIA